MNDSRENRRPGFSCNPNGIVLARGSVTRSNSRLEPALAISYTTGFRKLLRVADPRSAKS